MTNETRPDMSEINKKITEEFRANGGQVEMFKGLKILLMHHKGAKSGKQYLNPLAYLPVGENVAVFASMGGAPNNPDWYHNLVANPDDVKVELGDGKVIDARARVATGAERDELYAQQVAVAPMFGDYQKKTTRVIPVVVLERK